MNDKIESILTFVEKNLGPIIVHECKQILNMVRYQILFVLFILLLWGCCFVIVTEQDNAISTMVFCLTLLTIVVYPLQIITTNATSWSKDKLEMMQITSIRPSQIVWGRLIAGSFLSTLMIIIATPFLSLGYLVPGTDLLPLLVVLGLVFLYSVVVVMATIYCAWTIDQYSFAPFLKGLYVLGLLQVGSGCGAMFVVFLENLDQTEIWTSFFISIVVAFWVLIQLFVRTVLWLRHPTENKTTLLKVLDICNILIVLVLFCFPDIFSGSFIFDPTNRIRIIFYILFLMGGFLSSYLLENPKLPRRALLNVHKYVKKNIFLFPLLPGPGMGILFFCTIMFCVSLFFEILAFDSHYIYGSRLAVGMSCALFWLGVVYVQKIFHVFGWSVKPTILIVSYVLLCGLGFGLINMQDDELLKQLKKTLWTMEGMLGVVYPVIAVIVLCNWFFLKKTIQQNKQDIEKVFASLQEHTKERRDL